MEQPRVTPGTTRTKLFWVAVLYFAEGFPFGLLFDLYPVYFRSHGISLTEIGLLGLVGLPWTLKFLWAPVVDIYGSRRAWIRACQTLLAIDLGLLALLEPGQLSGAVWIGLLVLAGLAATQDVAIDAYTIQLLDRAELGPANGVRVASYRVALIVAGGVFVAGAGLLGWRTALLTAGALLAGLAMLASRLPETESGARPGDVGRTVRPSRAWPRSVKQGFVRPLREFWQRPGVLAVLAFVAVFKLGDMTLGPMVRPFWVDREFTPLQIGMIPGTFGVVSTIAGALLGGRLTRRWGLFRGLWLLGIAQAGSNLLYAATAALPRSEPLMYTASFVESFCGGLGTAPFLAFLMCVCTKHQAATQYALLSALFGLGRSLSASVSGVLTESLGYAAYFTASFLLAWPAFLLLPWVRMWTDQTQTEAAHSPSRTTPIGW